MSQLLSKESQKKIETFWEASTFTAIYFYLFFYLNLMEGLVEFPYSSPLSRQYIPQRSHGPRGITFSPDIERRANKDLMSLQLLQIHIKDRPSNNVGRQVGKVDDRVGGEGGCPNNLGCPPTLHHTVPKLCSILRPNFKVVPVHLLSPIMATITTIFWNNKCHCR